MRGFTTEELRALDVRIAIEVMGYKYFRPKSLSSYEQPTGLAYLVDSAHYGTDPAWMIAEDEWPRDTEFRALPHFTNAPDAGEAIIKATHARWREAGRRLFWRLETDPTDDAHIASIIEMSADGHAADILWAQERDEVSMKIAICKAVLAPGVLATLASWSIIQEP
ncbi:hypothetical protein CCAX7_14280 [Capsulimonas corticalis]|uniref:Uncharacterized protein n=1 Tax=Capsulimonas corticalis TaxID=2219043 RepID=A0A402D742_9BACT|nr:hypothetical protein [Capsulimonas corticalis]BDI29377.1 hypothetical protein CCAX7_14280 [Capsulimonas corticalis]